MSRRRRGSLSRPLIAVIVAAACLAPAPSALARTDPPSTLPGALARPGPSAEPPAPTVVRIIDGGFDWGSAAIGAGAGAAVVLLGMGAVRARPLTPTPHKGGSNEPST
jgi:hypothetical protein